MQKKNEDMPGFKLFVLIIFKAVRAPKRYAPPSPKKIFALGKLNNKNENNTIICPVNKKANSI